MEQPSVPLCGADCKGWHHFGSPYEIQACDESGRFDKEEFPDEAARIAHRTECGCQWPECDYQDAAMAWVLSLGTRSVVISMNTGNATLAPEDIDELEELLEVRGEEFISNVDKAIEVGARLFDKAKGKEQNALKGLLSLLKTVQKKLASEELKLKDFGSPPRHTPSIRKNMSAAEIVRAAEDRFLMETIPVLDELVHEAAAAMASDINNDGVESQVNFLIERYGNTEAQKLIFDIFQCTDPECPDAKTNSYHDHPNED